MCVWAHCVEARPFGFISPKQQRQHWEPVHRFKHSRAPQEAIIFQAERVVSGAI
jgi:hypothetical protein